MMYAEIISGAQQEAFNKTQALAAVLQRSLNSRLGHLIFKAEPSESAFNAGAPHNDNVISIVQVSSSEINIYKGDTRISLGGGAPRDGNHMVLINFVTTS